MPAFVRALVSELRRSEQRLCHGKRPRRRDVCRRSVPHCAYFHEGPQPARATDAGRGLQQDYAEWSADFIALCRAQLDLLADSISGVAQAALFFRREHPTTGALEFVPLVVLSNAAEPDRVWISTGSATELEVGAGTSRHSRELPGGIPAERLLPDYPFVAVGADGGIVMPDGGLCVPVEYNEVFAGSVVLWRETSPSVSTTAGQPWLPEEVARVRHVARSISLGAALEGKVISAAQTENNSKVLIESIRSLLRSSMHQIRSPIAALVTFGHLLLRKLPPGDSLRGLAKNIVVESLRLDDLLDPLDQVQKQLILEGGNGKVSNSLSREVHPQAMLRKSSVENGEIAEDAVSNGNAWTLQDEETEQENGVIPELIWISDILEPIANSAILLAQEKGLIFVSNIDEDTPPALLVERDVREAVYNLIDNAVRYTPVGGYVGMQSSVVEDDNRGVLIEVLIWDTGPGISDYELDTIWEKGRRGRAARASGMPGTGMGLAISREAITNLGGTIEVQSPLPRHLDPRKEKGDEQKGTVFRLRFPRAVM